MSRMLRGAPEGSPAAGIGAHWPIWDDEDVDLLGAMIMAEALNGLTRTLDLHSGAISLVGGLFNLGGVSVPPSLLGHKATLRSRCCSGIIITMTAPVSTLAVAESLTGGMLGSAIVSQSGLPRSSAEG